MDRLLQPATPPLDLRRQDTRRGLCYGRNDGEIGGVKTNPIHLSQAAKLSHQAGPPQSAQPCSLSPPKRYRACSDGSRAGSVSRPDTTGLPSTISPPSSSLRRSLNSLGESPTQAEIARIKIDEGGRPF